MPRSQQHEPSGLTALNDANDDARLDQLLHQYFRHSASSQAASQRAQRGRRRGRGGRMAPSVGREGEVESGVSREGCLKEIKKFLRDSSQSKHLERVYRAILHQLNKAKKDRTVIPLVLTLCDELFTRSAAFRALVTTQTASFYDQLLEGTGEKHVNVRRASKEQSPEVEAVLGLIETWTETFGARYPMLVAGQSVLVERGYVFPEVKKRAQHAEEANEARERHQARVHELKVKQMEREMERNIPEMETTISEMHSIFEILVPTLEAFELGQQDEQASVPVEKLTARDQADADEEEEGVEWEDVDNAGALETTTVANAAADEEVEDDVEWEDVASADDDGMAMEDMDINEIVLAYGLGSSSYQLTISIPTTLCEKSSENEVLFRTLADGVLQIRKRFLPLVNDWLATATSSSTSSTHERPVRRLMELQQRLEHVTLQWEDLVKENERKRFARIQPTVVTLPPASDEPLPSPKPSSKRPRRV